MRACRGRLVVAMVSPWWKVTPLDVVESTRVKHEKYKVHFVRQTNQEMENSMPFFWRLNSDSPYISVSISLSVCLSLSLSKHYLTTHYHALILVWVAFCETLEMTCRLVEVNLRHYTWLAGSQFLWEMLKSTIVPLLSHADRWWGSRVGGAWVA